MKLTNTLRQAFVSAAMNDVPNIDYTEQIRSIVNKQVARFLKIAGLDKADPTRLVEQYCRIKGRHYSARGLTYDERTSIENNEEIQALAAKSKEQSDARSNLEFSLKSALAACNTSKQAIEAFPEFEKYLPADESKAIRSLPVITNVFSDFVKAGWPKDQKRSNKLATQLAAQP